MEDYHVFSSENLTDWTDHGVIVSQNKVNWVDSTSYSMWAPDCIYRNGKYYFYFPSNTNRHSLWQEVLQLVLLLRINLKDRLFRNRNPLKTFMVSIRMYLSIKTDRLIYTGRMGNIFVAKLKDNMLELDSEPQVIEDLPEKGLKEGPLFVRTEWHLLYDISRMCRIKLKDSNMQWAIIQWDL